MTLNTIVVGFSLFTLDVIADANKMYNINCSNIN